MDLVPQPRDLLASDAERDRVAEALRGHATVGRLDADELEDRLGRAFAARTRAELVPLVADLPAGHEAAPGESRQSRAAHGSSRRELPSLAPVVALAILLVAIWALTGAGYFWPVWPIGAMLIGTFKHSGRGCRPVLMRRHG
jgi:hypothetical protein